MALTLLARQVRREVHAADLARRDVEVACTASSRTPRSSIVFLAKADADGQDVGKAKVHRDGRVSCCERILVTMAVMLSWLLSTSSTTSIVLPSGRVCDSPLACQLFSSSEQPCRLYPCHHGARLGHRQQHRRRAVGSAGVASLPGLRWHPKGWRGGHNPGIMPVCGFGIPGLLATTGDDAAIAASLISLGSWRIRVDGLDPGPIRVL